MNNVIGASELDSPRRDRDVGGPLERRRPAGRLPDRNRANAHGAARHQSVG